MRSSIEYSQSCPQCPRGAFHLERAQRGQEWRLPSPCSSLQFLLSSPEEQERGFLRQVWGLAQWPLEDPGGSSWAMTVLGTPILGEAVLAWGSLSSPPSTLVGLSRVDELGQGGSVGAACNKPTCLLPISLWPLCFPICPHEYSTDLLSWRLLSSALWHELLWADAVVQLTLRLTSFQTGNPWDDQLLGMFWRWSCCIFGCRHYFRDVMSGSRELDWLPAVLFQDGCLCVRYCMFYAECLAYDQVWEGDFLGFYF